MNNSNVSNVSRETLCTPSSYKVQAVKELVEAYNRSLSSALAALVNSNWDGEEAKSCPVRSSTNSASVTYLPINDLNTGLYFAPSVNPSQGIGMHMLVVKDEAPTYVLFIGFHEFSIICQIVAGIGQMKLVRGMKGVDECREVRTRQWVMSNVDKLNHRIVTCLFGSNLEELYTLL